MMQAGRVAQNQILTSGLLSSCCDDWHFVPILTPDGKRQKCTLQRPDYPLIDYTNPYPLSLETGVTNVRLNLGMFYFFPRIHSVSAGHLLSSDNLPITLFGTGKPTRKELMRDMYALFYTVHGLEPTFAAMLYAVTDQTGGFRDQTALQSYMLTVCKTPGAEMEVFGRIVGRILLHMQFKRKVIAFRLTLTGRLTLCLLQPSPTCLKAIEPALHSRLDTVYRTMNRFVPRDMDTYGRALVSSLQQVRYFRSNFFFILFDLCYEQLHRLIFIKKE